MGKGAYGPKDHHGKDHHMNFFDDYEKELEAREKTPEALAQAEAEAARRAKRHPGMDIFDLPEIEDDPTEDEDEDED